ncbi:hypothetical protein [Polycyclovorans algicola]|uniref:hypothetical protein n=1 Tax=Polycyclovorans algicola TaxID=616992 RepID=UPI0004A6AE43|nr:hypothetical protein [Polycyclovorans algicola]
MNNILSGKTGRLIAAAAALIGSIVLGGTAHAAVDAGEEQVSEAALAQRLGPATAVVLIEATALREQPRSDVRPGVAVPSGTQARAYQRVYNSDGHWHFIRVDDALGWVPSSTVQ